VSPKLRKLVPDEALFRRRAGDEPFRDLAPDSGVCHTTLSRYFARPEAARELQRMKRLIRAEQREAEADRRADERAKRAARRRLKQQPLPASSATEPPPAAAAAGEARPAQPGSGRPSRRPNDVVRSGTAEPPPARQGFAGFLDRKDAERAARVGRAPGQPANSPLEPREWLLHQVQLAQVNRDPEREALARQALAEWDAH
jgi:hypothetical protein